MPTLTPKPVASGFAFPECPRWHDGALWFSDMYGGRVYRLDASGNATVIAEAPARPAGLGFLADGALLVVTMADRTLNRLVDGRLEPVADLSALATGDTNDMVVDAQGRAYIGNFGFDIATEAPRPASLVCVEPDGSARVVAEDLAFPNGSVITSDGRTLIVAESFAHVLTAFDLASDGSLTNRRTWAALGERGVDGICLDEAGGVWLATFGPEFVRVREGGEVTDVIPLAGRSAVACMLGGADRRTLYLLSAEGTQEEMFSGRSRGYIDAVQVEVAGAGLP